jgi:DNA methylase
VSSAAQLALALDGAPPADFADALRRFSFDGASTAEFEAAGLRYFVNAFWTAAQRRGHSLHEISYRACFKSQLPAFFIERLTAPGDLVYDPFSGRGTTSVQAALMGRAPAANDVNPLSAMLSGPRFDPPSVRRCGSVWRRSNCRGRRTIRSIPTCWRSTIRRRCARSRPCAPGS